MVIKNLKDMPNFDWSSQNQRGSWSTQDVTNGEVFLDGEWNKPTCIEHGAMNCVSSSRDIWRCLICGRACYVVIQ